jgi:hypothetical protein
MEELLRLCSELCRSCRKDESSVYYLSFYFTAG